MKRELLISFFIHVGVLTLLTIISSNHREMKPPSKVYKVKVISGPKAEQPIKTKKKPPKKPEPKEKPQKKKKKEQKTKEQKKKVKKKKVKEKDMVVKEKAEKKEKKEEEEKEEEKEEKREPEPKEKAQPEKPEPDVEKDLKKGGAEVAVDQPNFDDSFYLNLIATKIGNNWRDPLTTTKRYRTIIYFKILPSGKITDAEIEQHSGNSLYDRSCLRAVLLSSPLPELPKSFSGDFLGVHFSFKHR